VEVEVDSSEVVGDVLRKGDEADSMEADSTVEVEEPLEVEVPPPSREDDPTANQFIIDNKTLGAIC
jgi:hypothetical protein